MKRNEVLEMLQMRSKVEEELKRLQRTFQGIGRTETQGDGDGQKRRSAGSKDHVQ